jgi:UPF0042 nucleotide-binding protein
MSVPLVVLTGVSGSGKTTALHALEDIGLYTVDNLPPTLWLPLVKLVSPQHEGLCVGIDIRARDYLASATVVLDELSREGIDTTVLFLDATDETLVRRYNFTRRTHPIAKGTLTTDLKNEREALAPLRALADEVIDTTNMSARALTQKLWDRFKHHEGFLLRLISFGFKRGLPTDVDTVLDVRGMPNPFYDEVLRALPGTDPRVQSYVFTPEGLETYTQLRSMVKTLVNQAQGAAGRNAYTVAIGCTGGQHRSVAVAERLGIDLAPTFRTQVIHRDLERALLEHETADSHS